MLRIVAKVCVRLLPRLLAALSAISAASKRPARKELSAGYTAMPTEAVSLRFPDLPSKLVSAIVRLIRSAVTLALGSFPLAMSTAKELLPYLAVHRCMDITMPDCQIKSRFQVLVFQSLNHRLHVIIDRITDRDSVVQFPKGF